MDSDDSCSDMFITQSSFRTNVETQEASKAADFLSDSFILPDELPTGDVVEYLDFSHEVSNAKNVGAEITGHASETVRNETVAVPPLPNIDVGQKPFVPLLPDLFDDNDVNTVSDEVLSAAVDTVLSHGEERDRHGPPVSLQTVEENAVKGYVKRPCQKVNFLNSFKYLFHGLKL